MRSKKFSQEFLESYPDFKNKNIQGRYFTLAHLEPELVNLASSFDIEKIGTSELGKTIYAINIGKGPVKIMAWSQMHGNESTTTKAILDLLNLLKKGSNTLVTNNILEQCTITIIPILNPDGAATYTRVNANLVDLNRDAHSRTQRESQVLLELYKKVKPDFCFNLHDQRTIFSAGPEPKPASISFLAPAMDEQRTVTESRKMAMQIIAAMNENLQNYLPGQVGRYDDSFNINCTGDTFQSFGVPTILFEAGHIPGDYMREESRKFMSLAIMIAIHTITKRDFSDIEEDAYFSIPENEKNFFDILLKNAIIDGDKTDVGIQYLEILKNNHIDFQPVVQLLDKESNFYGYQILDCQLGKVTHMDGKSIVENDVVDGILLNKKHISFKFK